MKTLKTLKTIAAVMAVSFSVSAMAGIPGLPSSYFSTSTNDAANVNITGAFGINAIITKMGATQGSVISTDDYWNAFIGDTSDPTAYFDYANAKPFVQELVFTVEGQQLVEENGGTGIFVHAGNTYTITYNKVSKFYDQRLSGSDTVINSGTWEFFADGSGVLTGDKYVAAHYEENDVWAGAEASALNDGSNVTAGDIDQKHGKVVGLLDIMGVYSGDTLSNIALPEDAASADRVRLNVVAAGEPLKILAAEAKVDVDAFNNANALIKKIDSFNKTANFLDINAATSALTRVIAQHNGFLGSSIKEKAKELKFVLEQFASQTAASATGRGLEFACEGQFSTGTNVNLACTELGAKFEAYAATADLSNVNDANTYNLAIDSLIVFATSIIEFNVVAGSYDAAAAATSIIDQYTSIDSGGAVRTVFGAVNSGFGDGGEIAFGEFDSDFDLGIGNGDLF